MSDEHDDISSNGGAAEEEMTLLTGHQTEDASVRNLRGLSDDELERRAREIQQEAREIQQEKLQRAQQKQTNSGQQCKAISCRAAVAWASNEPLSIETVEVDPPKYGEVRIRIHFTSICQTDVFILKGVEPSLKFPMVPGHEAVGIVESIGPGVESLKPEDHVIPSPVSHCRRCDNCLNPGASICKWEQAGQTMHDGQTRFRCKGKQLFHFLGLSTFSEYTVVREIQLCKIKVDPKAPLDKMCLIGCAIATGYGATKNIVRAGNTAIVREMNAIGLATVMGCKAQGAQLVLAMDDDNDKLLTAILFGTNDLVNSTELLAVGKPLTEHIREKFGCDGFDFFFDATGHPLPTVQASACLKRDIGQYCLLGVNSHKLFVLNGGILDQRPTEQCCVMGGFKPRDAVPVLVEQYLTGELLLDNFSICPFPLEQINDGVERLDKNQRIRSVVAMVSA